MVYFFSLFFILYHIFHSIILAQSNPKVVYFQPLGKDVRSPRQVIIQFSEDMVPLGSPSRNAKILESNCLSLGNSRWLDSKTWVLDFKSALPNGKKCNFQLNSDLTSLKGKKIEGKRNFEFSTSPISARLVHPTNIYEILEDEIFIFSMDGKVQIDTFLLNSYIQSDKIKSKIQFDVIDLKGISEVLKNRYYEPLEDENSTIIAVKPRSILPESSKIQFIISKKTASLDGIEMEKDEIFDFKVREKFKATIICERESSQKNCMPLEYISLKFNAYISSEIAKKIYIQDPNGRKIPPKLTYLNSSNLVNRVDFEAPFLEQSNYKIFIPDGLKDDTGRTLSNQNSFPLIVTTDRYPPLAKFSSNFGVLESKASPILPVTIRKLESETYGKILYLKPEELNGAKISQLLKLNELSENDNSIFSNQKLNLLKNQFNESKLDIRDLQLPKLTQDGSMEVVGIPLLRNGLFLVEIKSKILGKALFNENKEFFVSSSALVTNLSVHLKKGKDNTLVWVTELSSGKPVSSADVIVTDCQSKNLAVGKTNESGIFLIDGNLDKKVSSCGYSNYDNGIFVIAKKDNDVSFVHSSWTSGIEPWRFKISKYFERDDTLYHIFLDRTLLKKGEKVHFKIYSRRKTSKGLAIPAANTLYKFLIIHHPGTDSYYNIPLTWDSLGQSTTTWTIPKTAPLGSYSIYLANDKEVKIFYSYMQEDVVYLGGFRVEEFRLPIIQASISSIKSNWIATDKIPITLQAKFFAGGSASNLPVTFRYRIEPADYTNSRYPGFTFNQKPIQAGKYRYSYQSPKTKIHSTQLTLNKEGLANTFIDWDEMNVYSHLDMEMEFKDPSGEIQSVASKFSLYPSNLLVGIDNDYELKDGKIITLKSIVLDTNGNPLKGIPIEVHAFENIYYTHRKRLVGGFYSFDEYNQINPIGKVCEGVTQSNGRFICNTKPILKEGRVILEVRAKPNTGNRVYSNISVWIPSKDDWWYSALDSDRMDLVADKENYNVGDKAKIKIEAPFPSYTALITVERSGIIQSFVKEIDGKNPFIEIPIQKNYVPNIYTSVLAVRGRVDSPKETSMVDLARPSFKLGILELKVGWNPHKLDIKVSTDKKEYKPRSKGEVLIEVSHQGKKVPSGEVAVAIVDEALLELSNNTTTNLLKTMMEERSLDIKTSTLQMHVVGKRHFGKKAIPTGGGGGKSSTRELFDTLLLWNPSVKLTNGEARVPFGLKDSLTRYKILVVATSREDLFGDGEGSFVSSQDILLFSGLPPVVRTGDLLVHEFTVKNNTNQEKKLKFQLKAWGVNGLEEFPTKEFVIKANSSEKLTWEKKIGQKAGNREIQLDMYVNENLEDSIKILQKIDESIPVRITQGILFRLDKNNLSIPIELPNQAKVEDAGIRLKVAPTILASVDGIRSYMENYPYTCMEQLISKAIVKEDNKEKEKILSDLPGYLDVDGLVKYFPNSTWGDEVLTAYILILTHEANWKLEKSLLEKMILGLNKYLDGTLSRRIYSYYNDSIIRRILIWNALVRYINLNPETINTNIDPNELPNSSLIQYIYLLEKLNFPGYATLVNNAKQALKARLDYQGSEMKLRDNIGSLWWMMGSSDLDNSLFMIYAASEKDYKNDIPKLIYAYSNSLKKGRLDTTLANSFGYLALKKLARIYENEKIQGKTSIQFGSQLRNIQWDENSQKQVTHESTIPFVNKKQENLKFQHEGMGAPWVFVSTEAKYPLNQPIMNGVMIEKTIKPVLKKNSSHYSVGDVIQIQIKWKLSAPRTMFVVSDPIPTGSIVLGSGLGRESSLLSNQNIEQNTYYINYIERSFTHFRAYFDYLPEGEHVIEYTLRLNQSGVYQIPPTRLEAMYSPDIYGEYPNSSWTVIE